MPSSRARIGICLALLMLGVSSLTACAKSDAQAPAGSDTGFVAGPHP